MDLTEIRAKRVALEFKLGGMISQFEDETGLDVGERVLYNRLWADRDQPDAGPTPCCELTIEIGYGDAPK
jgi:hypothetical protein